MRKSLFLSTLVFIPFAAGAASVAFSDVPDGAWFARYVYDAAGKGIVSGYTDAQGRLTGKFGPGDSVTIGQALKMAMESSGNPADMMRTDSPFLGHWAQRYADAAVEMDFGVNLTLARLDGQATRAEMAQIAADAYGKRSTDVVRIQEYTDVTVTHPHAAAINAVTDANIMVGDGRAQSCSLANNCVRTTFRPNASINRAEAVKIVMEARTAWRNGGIVPPMSSSSRSSSSSSLSANTIRYTASGFVPSTLTITKGAMITIVNETAKDLEVGSDPHPQHTDYPLMNALDITPPKGFYKFTFNVEGEYKFHNHLNASHKGTIIVK